jgi:hypothetical protein
MRCAVQISFPAEAGNAAVKAGKLGEVIATFMEKWRPEAAYFFPREGKRGAIFILNLDEPSQLPPMLEPLFMNLNAEVYISPVMTADDVKKGLSAIEKEFKR